MKYFKIIKDNNIIGIVTSNDFLGYIPRLDYFIRADETTGEYVSYKGKYYRSYWMQPYQREIEHIVAEITSISEEEYNILKEALEENEEIIIEPDDGNDEPEIPVIPDQPEDPDITLNAEERSVGGLGVYMVKKTMDEVHYEYSDGMNHTTIRKMI